MKIHTPIESPSRIKTQKLKKCHLDVNFFYSIRIFFWSTVDPRFWLGSVTVPYRDRDHTVTLIIPWPWSYRVQFFVTIPVCPFSSAIVCYRLLPFACVHLRLTFSAWPSSFIVIITIIHDLHHSSWHSLFIFGKVFNPYFLFTP